MANLESDGPYPGETQLENGANSTDKWVNDGQLQTSWAQCPEGKNALGGGFQRGDAGGYEDLKIVSSAPVEIGDSGPILDGTHSRDPDDPDWSLTNPNGWLVEGYYTGDAPVEVIVRPHVICANVG